jgi:peroxiredoxin
MPGRAKPPKEELLHHTHAVGHKYPIGQIVKSLMIAAVAFLSFSLTTLRAQDKQQMIGEAAPRFELQGLDGKTYSLAESKGKYVVLHFATTWCPFCNAEASHLEELSRSYSNKGVQVFIVDVKENAKQVEKWATRFNFSFPVLLDHDGSVSSRYAPEGVQPDLARDEVPLASNLIIDPAGKIRFYSLLNTAAFDAKLSKVKQTLDELLKTGN